MPEQFRVGQYFERLKSSGAKGFLSKKDFLSLHPTCSEDGIQMLPPNGVSWIGPHLGNRRDLTSLSQKYLAPLFNGLTNGF
jgi:hypothetical protein